MAKKPLTAAEVAAITRPGMTRVDRNLYLQHRPEQGARSWLFRYSLAGKAHWLGLGPVDLVSLADAKAETLRLRRALMIGEDPAVVRAADRAPTTASAAAVALAVPSVPVPTFAACAERYIADHEAGWKSAKQAAQWSATIRTYAEPVIGRLPVNEVTTKHVVKILRPIWTTKSETAGRLRGRLEAIFSWAVAMNYRPDNPADRRTISHLLPALSKVKKVAHHAAMPYAELPAFMVRLRKLTSVSAKALDFTILTAARTGETIGADWSEIDLEAKTWTVPAERMKAGREHVVPLPDAAVALLREMGPKESGYVFPGAKEGKPLSDMALTMVIRKMKLPTKATTHGFRSSFSDWVSEETDTMPEVREMALAHAIASKAEAAYRRGDLLAKRRELMAAWADYLEGSDD